MDGFAIVVQALLALMAFSTLVVKRDRELPRRPFEIWLCDSSKQGLGAMFAHLMNVLLSLMLASNAEVEWMSGNACTWYFLNVLFDTTIGVFILSAIMMSMRFCYQQLQWKDLVNSGEYGGYPPKLSIWFKQLTGFLFALALTKLVVSIMLIKIRIFAQLAEQLLSPIRDPRTQLVVVMLVFPLVMNILQFWLIDNIIKSTIDHSVPSEEEEPQQIPTEDESDDDSETEEENCLHFVGSSNNV